MIAYKLGETLGYLAQASIAIFVIRCAWKNWKARKPRDGWMS